jgi:hypothetical protein
MSGLVDFELRHEGRQEYNTQVGSTRFANLSWVL